MKIKLLHLLPGRVRLRVKGMRNNYSLSYKMKLLFSKIPGVREVRANPITGSLLIYYNPVQINHFSLISIADSLRKGKSKLAENKVIRKIPQSTADWHMKEFDEALHYFSSNQASGLTSTERNLRLIKYGFNSLSAPKKVSWSTLLKDPFKDFTVQLLLGTSLISILAGQFTEAIAIIAIVGVEVIVGVIQSLKAEKSMDSLKKLGAPRAKVLIEGKVIEVPSRKIVPGDIILVEEGDTIPADSRLIEAINLEIDEAYLTGESIAVSKSIDKCTGLKIPLAERTNMIFMGTGVTRGRATAIVVSTGLQTEMGRLAKMLVKRGLEPTPLQRQLEHLIKKLTFTSLLISGGVIGIDILRGRPLLETIRTGLSLAVGIIPEGLPVVVSIALASGAHRMVRKNAVVRNMSAVETLGNATVICTDKTGTLTRNEMTVTEIYSDGSTWEISGEGYVPTGVFTHNGQVVDALEDKKLCRVLLAAALCNNAHINYDGKNEPEVTGDPTEIALLAVAIKGGVPWPEVNNIYCRDKEVAFDCNRKMMTVVCRDQKNKASAYSKGAPDNILTKCDRVYKNNEIAPLDLKTRKAILSANEAMAQKALRVLAVAFKPVHEDKGYDADGELEHGLIFLGLLGLMDPPRPGVLEAIEKSRQAGIKVVMITGDHPLTAKAIAGQIGLIHEGKILTGPELDQMTDEVLLNQIDEVEVFARTSPEHKLRIVRAYKKSGHIVAMTGDGVNDGPAVKEAHIGIAMGRKGTDIAREAAAITLTDDDFTTIVAAVEEGRTVRGNINKSLQYVLTGNFAEVLTFFLAAVSGMPLPLASSQILLVNFMTESVPVLALGAGLPKSGIMNQSPNSPSENLLSRELGKKILTKSILTGLTTFGLFAGTSILGGGLVKARTMALANLAVSQLFNLFRCQDTKSTLIKADAFQNKLLIPSAAFSSGLLLTAIYLPSLQGFLQLAPLRAKDWSLIFLTSGLTDQVENILLT